MENKKIEEGNRLIAEFMSGKPCNRCKDCGMYIFENGDEIFEKYLDYHKSWDRLMPVFNKCHSQIVEKLGNNKRGMWTPENGYVSNLHNMKLNTPIEHVYEEIIIYIKKYNGK